MSLDVDSLERLVPQYVQDGDITGQETLELHVARYEFAAQYTNHGRLLDIASGTGYGTRLLFDRLKPHVVATGVDVSEEAISYAKANYDDNGIRFIVDDAMRFCDPEGFNTIISLETIEHLPDPDGFISHLVTLLHPGGIFVGSVPTTPSVDANPHHLHDFTTKTFRGLFELHGFEEIACFRQSQRFNPFSLLARKEARAKNVRRNLPKYYCVHPDALLRRIGATFRYGFTNRYITVAWRMPC